MVPVNAPGVVAFYQQRDILWAATELFWVLFPALVLSAGWSVWLRNRALAWTRQRYYLALSLFTGLYLVAAMLAAMPLAYYRDVIHLRSWHHRTPDALTWLSSQVISSAALVVAGIVFVMALFAIIRRDQKWWWVWASLTALVLLIAALETSQLVINASVQHWMPLKDQQLVGVLRGFEQRCGLSNVPVYVGGNDTTVAGLGPTKRIVIATGDLKSLPRPQLIVAVAHELKHYRMGDDDWIATLAAAGIIFLCFSSVAIIGPFIARKRSDLVGSNLADIAVVPLVLAVLTGSWLLLGSPIFNGLQRHLEFDADKFALELTRDNGALIALQQTMIRMDTWPRLVEYYPFYQYARANHPSDANRIRFALAYHPWREGKPGIFSNVCKAPP